LLILLALVVVIGVAASSLLSRFQTPSPELLTLVPTLTDTETPTNGAMPSDMPPVMPPLIVLPTENPPVTIPLSPTHSPMPTLLDPQGTLASGLTATQVALIDLTGTVRAQIRSDQNATSVAFVETSIASRSLTSTQVLTYCDTDSDHLSRAQYVGSDDDR